MYKAAESYGLTVKLFKCSPENLKKEGKFPCIIHWNFNHFVVLDGFKGKYVYLNDPAKGMLKVAFEEFDRSFTGVVMLLVPGETFERGGQRKSTFDFAKKRLTGAWAAVAFVLLTGVIASLFGLTNPVMSKIFMDRLLTDKNPDWLMPFIGFMTGLAFLQIVVEWIRAIYRLKLNGKMAVIGSSTYMWKVLSMPMEFFSQRMAGDIQTRRTANAGIAATLVDTFAPMVLNTVMMVFYMILMFKQSLMLTAVGICTLVCNVLLSQVIAQKRLNITRVMQRDSAKLDATTVAGIEMISF